jgi:hypothetical protein
MLNLAPRHEDVWGNRGMAPLILNVGVQQADLEMSIGTCIREIFRLDHQLYFSFFQFILTNSGIGRRRGSFIALNWLKLKLIKDRRPVCLGVGLSSGAHDQIFVFCLTIAGFLMWGTLFDEKMGLWFTWTITSGPCQSSDSWVEVPQNSRPYFTVSSETPPTWRARSPHLYPQGTGWPRALGSFLSPLTTRRALRWSYSNPPPHGDSMHESESELHYNWQSVSKSWCRAQSGTFGQRSIFFKVTVLSFGATFSDERSGLSFISPCQYSLEWSVSIYIIYL